MIKTNQFTLSQRDFFNIILRFRLRKMWWIFFVILFLVGSNLLTGKTDGSVITLIILFFVYAAFFIIQTWMQAYRSKNPLLFKPRQVAIENDILRITTISESVFDSPVVNEMPVESIYRIKKDGAFLLLFMAPTQFIIVPLSAFPFPGDEEKFVQALGS